MYLFQNIHCGQIWTQIAPLIGNIKWAHIESWASTYPHTFFQLWESFDGFPGGSNGRETYKHTQETDLFTF